jgi:hypothetical protein
MNNLLSIMKKLLLLITPFVLTLCVVPAFADKAVSINKNQAGYLNAVSYGTVGSPLGASISETLVYYPLSTGTNYSILSPVISTATTNFSNLYDYYIGDDGFGDVLEAYPANGATSYATAVSNNSYFTVTLNGSSTVNMDTLVFEIAKGGSADPRGYFVRSSIDGFTSDLISETLPSGFNAAPVRKSIALGSAFDGVSSVTFRFYVFTPDPTDNSVDWSDLYIKGGSGSAVPVSKWTIIAAMLLIALLALFREQKKRKIALKA